SAPPTTSEWPSRYLVVECVTMSHPKASGFCRNGVANVLSHIVRTPRPRHIPAIAAMSHSLSSGVDGVSIAKGFVFGRSAVSTLPRSEGALNENSRPYLRYSFVHRR